MYNPLERFAVQMLPGFLAMEVRYFVSQTYKRGEQTLVALDKQPLLLTDYKDVQDALLHYMAVKEQDQWAAVIDLKNPVHINKLERMAEDESAYLLYVAFIRDAEKVNIRNDKVLKEAVRHFIGTDTTWKPANKETVVARMELIRGVLMLTLQYDRDRVSIELTAIEQRIASCATTFHSRPVSESYRIIFQDSGSIRS